MLRGGSGEDDEMATKAEQALELFRRDLGAEEGVSAWMQVTQDRINRFADATDDHQFIHVDPERSAQLSPYKVTIAHGFLTLSLIVPLGTSIPPRNPQALQGVVMGVNYGLDKVRFPAPVRVDSRIRARQKLLAVELKSPNTLQISREVTIEIEGDTKPACVAEFLTRLVYS
jgi:acyl dehydratase